MAYTRDPISKSIQWDFTVNEGVFVARYGRAGGQFYKQFMIAGIIDDQTHPPKPIPEALYNVAARQPSKSPLEH